jgi:pyruvate dehydrogenase E1 component beta subunit
VPLDVNAIGSSLHKTGRVVIVHEAARTMGFGAEISATIAERFVDFLESPVIRVAGWDAPYPPYTKIEQFYRPDARRVALAIKQALDY